jgi:hypothetical protein
MGIFDDFVKTLRGADNAVPDEDTSQQEPILDEDGLSVDDRIAQEQADLANFLKRTEETRQRMIEQGIDVSAPEGFVPSTTPDGSIDVTEQVTAARNPVRNQDFIYGERPELSFLTRIGAKFSDFVNPEDLPNQSQQERDAYLKELAEFDARAEEIYQNSVEVDLPEARLLGIDLTGMTDDEFISDGKVRVFKYLDENSEVKSVLIPRPGSNMFERVVGQAGRTIFSELYGLVEREDDGSLDVNFLEDSDYATAVPDYDQSAGEGLLTDLLVFGVPGVAAEKTGKAAVGVGSELVKKADKVLPDNVVGNTIRGAGSVVDNAVQYAGGSLAVALTEGVLSQEGDEGLIFDAEMVKKTFTGVNDEQAADLAMIFDGLVVNGVFDTFLGVAGLALRKVGDMGSSSQGLINKKFVRDKAQRAAILGVITTIDPALKNLNAQEVAEASRALAQVLKDNATVLATVGNTAEEIPVDTVNALAAGAKKYITVTRQRLQNTMKPDEWERYVEKEANSIVSNTIGVTRGSTDNSMIRDKQAEMINSAGNLFEKEAKAVNPDDVNFDTETVPDLVDNRNLDLQEIDAEISAAETQAGNLRAEAGSAVQNDPLIKEMIAEVDPSRFFDDTRYVEQLTNLYGKTFVDEYRAAYDSVKAAYEAIPNDPIDMPAFKTQLANVFNNAGGLGETTQDGAPILAKLKQVFGDKISPSSEPSLMGDPREGASAITPQQVIDGLTDDIGFQDLYSLKKEIDKLISSTNNRNVAASLVQLRDHITSKAVNEAGEATGQLAYVSRNGGDTADIASAADNLFIETQSKFQNSMTTQNLSDASFTPAYAGTSTPVPEGGSRRGQPDLETNSVANTNAMLSDRTGNQLEQLQFALSGALSKGEVNKPFIDLFVAEQADKLAKALQNNDTQTIEQIDAAFEGIIGQLRSLDSPLVEELNAAKSRILSVQDELGNRALAADEVADMARQRKIAAEETIVAQFLSRSKKGAAQSNPSITVKRELLGSDPGNFIDALMTEIDKLPADQQIPARMATQSMLLRTINDTIKTSTAIAPGGMRDVSTGQLAKLTNERASGLIDAVSRAFPNDQFMKDTMMLTLGSLQDLSLSARMKVARSGSDTAANLGVRDSVSTGILFAFGYMNPAAAAARRITAGQIEAMEKLGKEEQQRIIGTILANPEDFADLARKIASGADPKLLTTMLKNFLSAANRTMQYELRVGDESDQTGEMLLDAVDTVMPQ